MDLKISESIHNINLSNLNSSQLAAVLHNDGPLLIIAGPGTGKTFTLVKKITYLLMEKKVSPESIIVTTFTLKAANELKLRVAQELKNCNFILDLNRINIGTIHSLCQKIISEQNFMILDETEQKYLIHKNINRFRKVEGFNSLVISLKLRDKKLASELYSLFSKFSESEIAPDTLYHSSVPQLQTLGILYSLYLQLLEENSFLDFSKILTQCNKILEKDSILLDSLHNKYQYILVDEFQDTNDLQWEIILKLSNNKKNICVVGDDDQAIYRFRGASTKNILNFFHYFREQNCKVIKLQENFRSNGEIIDFYSDFIKEFSWEGKRYEKQLVASTRNISSQSNQGNSIFKITSSDRINLNKKICQTLLTLKEANKIKDYSQVAFLFRSVKSREALSLIDTLNSQGIKTYSPRSGEFFQRKEIIFTLGVTLLLFKSFNNKVKKFSKESYMNFSDKYFLYSNYLKMMEYSENFLNKKDNTLKEWVQNFHERDIKSFLPIFYELFKFQIYQELFSKSRIGDIRNELIEKNISILANIFSKFEENGKSVLSEEFFDEYLPFLMEIGINEYEDEEDISIPDHVSFLTFHQSKGLEFPVVFIGSLDSTPEKSDKNSLREKLREEIFEINRNQFEREETMDFYRIFYTGFSRAKNLLFLTAEYRENKFPKSPSNFFLNSLERLREFPEENALEDLIKNLFIENIKSNEKKKRYSYTGDIVLYSHCPIKYRFLKYIGFPSIHNSKEILGTLVHKTIDDVHQNILKGTFITEDFMKFRLRENYDFLKKKLNMKLSKEEASESKRQVFLYLSNNGEKLLSLHSSELPLSSLRKNYVVDGIIDMVLRGEDGVSVVDFKTSEFPPEKIPEVYKKQLFVYSYLLRENGYSIKDLNLYYTADPDSRFLTLPSDEKLEKEIMEEFDSVVKKIEGKEFFSKTSSPHLCPQCQFRFYCETILF